MDALVPLRSAKRILWVKNSPLGLARTMLGPVRMTLRVENHTLGITRYALKLPRMTLSVAQTLLRVGRRTHRLAKPMPGGGTIVTSECGPHAESPAPTSIAPHRAPKR